METQTVFPLRPSATSAFKTAIQVFLRNSLQFLRALCDLRGSTCDS